MGQCCKKVDRKKVTLDSFLSTTWNIYKKYEPISYKKPPLHEDIFSHTRPEHSYGAKSHKLTVDLKGLCIRTCNIISTTELKLIEVKTYRERQSWRGSINGGDGSTNVGVWDAGGATCTLSSSVSSGREINSKHLITSVKRSQHTWLRIILIRLFKSYHMIIFMSFIIYLIIFLSAMPQRE